MTRRSAQVPLSEEEAFAVLEPYFKAASGLYEEYCERIGMPFKRVRLECRTDMHDTPRHFAGASTDGRLIAVAPHMADLPEDTVAAIFAHEFGHIIDHQNPGVFALRGEELVRHRGTDEKHLIARMKQWDARDYDAVEITADLIAQQVIGKRIGYSGPCLLQGFDRGVPRPRGLR